MDKKKPFKLADFFKHRIKKNTAENRTQTNGISGGWKPKVNQVETKSAYLTIVVLPHVPKESITVETVENFLKISGKYIPSPSQQGGLSHGREEYSDGMEFKLRHPVPENVDRSKIEATFHNELLTVRMPKIENSRPPGYSIEIK